MEKQSLYIYKVDEQGNKVLFPNTEYPAKLGKYTYTAQRMGGAPTITGTLMYKKCLDDYWTHKEYVEVRGEKYYVDQVPTSSKENTSLFYKHELTLVSERIILENTLFFDVVTDNTEEQYKDRYRSNNTDISFYGDIREFVSRINDSIIYSGLYDTEKSEGYRIVIDEGIESEIKQVSFDRKYLSEALQEIHNTFELSYYFVGKTCHVGYSENAITIPFEYGLGKGLISISKINSNYKIIDRITGAGSSENIPYYYPNESPDGSVLYHVVSTDALKISNIDLQKLRLAVGNPYQSFVWVQEHLSLKEPDKSITLDFRGLPQYYVTFEYAVSGKKGLKYKVIPSLLVKGGEFKLLTFGFNVHGVKYEGSEERTFTVAESDFTVTVFATIAIRHGEFSGYSRTVINDTRIEELAMYGFSYGENCFVDYASSGITFAGNENNVKLGTVIKITGHRYITPTGKLMPSVYRETEGADRFYNAVNNKYDAETYLPKSVGATDTLVFNNTFEKGKQREGIQDFDDIKPTIKDVKNSSGMLFGEIADIAFDENDNDLLGDGVSNNVFNGTDEYVHSYFYIKLNILDGDYGFNLFAHAIEGSAAYIEMTSGNCAACKFEIGVVKEQDGNKYIFHNPVLTNLDGSIAAGDFEQKVASYKSDYQKNQQDTQTNSVWIAVKKDNSTFGIVMPNVTNNYKPGIGDTFVITGISMPAPLVRAAEKRLDASLVKHMKENNDEKFTFSVNFSRIFIHENETVFNLLNENARINVIYNGESHALYISNYTCKADDKILYEISTELTDTLTISQNTLQRQMSSVKKDIMSSLSGINGDILKFALKYLLRKDVDDTAAGVITFLKGILFGKGTYGITGDGVATLRSLFTDFLQSGDIRTDYLTVTKAAHFFKLVIDELKSVGGQIIVTAANCTIDKVEPLYGTDGETQTGWRCRWRAKDAEGNARDNQWAAGDQAIVWTCNLADGETMGASNRYWWRLVTQTGTDTADIGGEEHLCHYIDVSTADADSGSVPPQPGDEVSQLGNRTDKDRQGAIIIAAYNTPDKDLLSPSIAQYTGIDGYDLSKARRTWFAANGNQITGDLRFITDGGEEKDVKSQFDFTADGIISAVTSVRYDLTETDSCLANASFVSGMEKWETGSTVLFSLADSLLFAGRLLSWASGTEDNEASVVTDGWRRALYMSSAWIKQRRADYRRIPDYETPNGVLLRKPKAAYVAFLYRSPGGGHLTVTFEGAHQTGFEAFDMLTVDEDLPPTGEYRLFRRDGVWNGTGDFRLAFTGEIYLSTVVLGTDSGDALAYRYKTLFEQSDKIVRIAAENFDDYGRVSERSEIATTAEMNRVVSEKFNDDGTLRNTSGLVTMADRSGLYAQGADGKTAILGVLVEETDGQGTRSVIKLTADNIRLEGLVTANGNFRVFEDGSITAVRGFFGGLIMKTRTVITEDNYREFLYGIEEQAGYNFDPAKLTPYIVVESLPEGEGLGFMMQGIRPGVSYTEAYKDRVRGMVGNTVLIYSKGAEVSVSGATADLRDFLDGHFGPAQSFFLSPGMFAALECRAASVEYKGKNVETVWWTFSTGYFE